MKSCTTRFAFAAMMQAAVQIGPRPRRLAHPPAGPIAPSKCASAMPPSPPPRLPQKRRRSGVAARIDVSRAPFARGGRGGRVKMFCALPSEPKSESERLRKSKIRTAQSTNRNSLLLKITRQAFARPCCVGVVVHQPPLVGRRRAAERQPVGQRDLPVRVGRRRLPAVRRNAPPAAP